MPSEAQNHQPERTTAAAHGEEIRRTMSEGDLRPRPPSHSGRIAFAKLGGWTPDEEHTRGTDLSLPAEATTVQRKFTHARKYRGHASPRSDTAMHERLAGKRLPPWLLHGWQSSPSPSVHPSNSEN